jgi:hypothetical protein
MTTAATIPTRTATSTCQAAPGMPPVAAYANSFAPTAAAPPPPEAARRHLLLQVLLR